MAMTTEEMREALKGGTVTCKWFALCENVATTTRPHGLLGDVPICERCDDKMNNIGGAK